MKLRAHSKTSLKPALTPFWSGPVHFWTATVIFWWLALLRSQFRRPKTRASALAGGLVSYGADVGDALNEHPPDLSSPGLLTNVDL